MGGDGEESGGLAHGDSEYWRERRATAQGAISIQRIYRGWRGRQHAVLMGGRWRSCATVAFSAYSLSGLWKIHVNSSKRSRDDVEVNEEEVLVYDLTFSTRIHAFPSYEVSGMQLHACPAYEVTEGLMKRVTTKKMEGQQISWSAGGVKYRAWAYGPMLECGACMDKHGRQIGEFCGRQTQSQTDLEASDIDVRVDIQEVGSLFEPLQVMATPQTTVEQLKKMIEIGWNERKISWMAIALYWKDIELSGDDTRLYKVRPWQGQAQICFHEHCRYLGAYLCDCEAGSTFKALSMLERDSHNSANNAVTIIKAFDNTDEDVRSEAINALVRVASTMVESQKSFLADHLKRKINQCNKELRTRKEAAATLAKIAAEEVLLTLSDDKHLQTQELAEAMSRRTAEEVERIKLQQIADEKARLELREKIQDTVAKLQECLESKHEVKHEQKYAIQALLDLMRLAGDGYSQMLIWELGGMRAVVDVMTAFPGNQSLQQQGFQTILSVIKCRKVSSSVPGSSVELVLTMTNMVISVLEQPTGSREVLELACEVLGALIAKEVSSEHFRKLAVAQQRHPGNMAIVMRVMPLLRRFATANRRHQQLAGEWGAIEAANAVLCSLSTGCLELPARLLSDMLTESAINQRRAKRLDTELALTHALRFLEQSDVLEVVPTARDAVEDALTSLRSGSNYEALMLSTDFAMRRTACFPIKNTAMRGIKLMQMLDLAQFIGRILEKYDIVAKSSEAEGPGSSLEWATLSMYQVCEYFVMPLTRSAGSSYVETIAHCEQPPMWMLSHWWGTDFGLTVKMLQLHAKSRYGPKARDVTYWCCTMANNQRQLDELKEEDILASPFARVMLNQGCMGTLLVCDTKVTPLTRAWCVFETHITQHLRSGSPIGVGKPTKQIYFLDVAAPVQNGDSVIATMLQDALGGNWHEVSDCEGTYFPLEVATRGVHIDISESQASVEVDKFKILNFISSGVASASPAPVDHPKYAELNGFVSGAFAAAELYRLAAEQPEGCQEEMCRLLHLRSDPNKFVRHGNTPLFAVLGADMPTKKAARNPAMQRDLINLLVEFRADVNHVNSSMNTVMDFIHNTKTTRRDVSDLLRSLGARRFDAELAVHLENKANEQLKELIATGFATPWQAFQGGEAGTKLGSVAKCSLHAVAGVLRMYHKFPRCLAEICVYANEPRQAALAPARVESVLEILESAGSKNVFVSKCLPQVPILDITLQLTQSRAGHQERKTGQLRESRKESTRQSRSSSRATRSPAGRVSPHRCFIGFEDFDRAGGDRRVSALVPLSPVTPGKPTLPLGDITRTGRASPSGSPGSPSCSPIATDDACHTQASKTSMNATRTSSLASIEASPMARPPPSPGPARRPVTSFGSSPSGALQPLARRPSVPAETPSVTPTMNLSQSLPSLKLSSRHRPQRLNVADLISNSPQ